MKWFFALLVLLNVGFWMWSDWYQEMLIQDTRPARPAVQAEKMRLLSESAKAPTGSKEPARPPAAAPLAPAPACYELGPITGSQLLNQVSEQLGRMSVTFAHRTSAERQVSGYRVYLEPFTTPRAAERKRRELSRLGIDDHAVIKDPSRRNAISLGLFSRKPLAENHVQDLAKKGIHAQIETVYRAVSSHWLNTNRVTPQAALEMKSALAALPGVGVKETSCPSDHSTTALP